MERICTAEWNSQLNTLILPHGPKEQPWHTGPTWARGLTKTLSATFSPEFSISLALQGVATIKAKKHGKQQGVRVDAEMERWVLYQQVPTVPSPGFCYLQAVLAQRGWQPVTAQLALGCQALRLATKLDLLCRDGQGRLILIELKCGFDDYFYVHNQGLMQAPYSGIPISFHTKACLQLLLTTWLFFHSQHTYSAALRTSGLGGSYLLHLFTLPTPLQGDGRNSKAGLRQPENTLAHSCLPLPFWCFSDDQVFHQALQIMKESRSDNKRKRQNVLENGSKRARYKAASYGKKKQ
jgi:hypothetical protein